MLITSWRTAPHRGRDLRHYPSALDALRCTHAHSSHPARRCNTVRGSRRLRGGAWPRVQGGADSLSDPAGPLPGLTHCSALSAARLTLSSCCAGS